MTASTTDRGPLGSIVSPDSLRGDLGQGLFWIFICAMVKKIPKGFNVSPMALICPFCKAEIGEPCIRVGNELELVHLERIKAAAEMDLAAKKSRIQ